MVRLRYRVDGVLIDMPPPPKNLQLALASRIKIMSSLDIAERRLPQDGRMRVKVGGKDFDLRVSFLPTVHGEKMRAARARQIQPLRQHGQAGHGRRDLQAGSRPPWTRRTD